MKLPTGTQHPVYHTHDPAPRVIWSIQFTQVTPKGNIFDAMVILKHFVHFLVFVSLRSCCAKALVRLFRPPAVVVPIHSAVLPHSLGFAVVGRIDDPLPSSMLLSLLLLLVLLFNSSRASGGYSS